MQTTTYATATLAPDPTAFSGAYGSRAHHWRKARHLVQQVPFESPAQVSILDISLEKNRAASDKLLAAGVGETAEWLRSRYGQWLGCPGNG